MDFPSKCPYCGKDIVENCEKQIFDTYNSIGIHKCIHCAKPIFIIERKDSEGHWKIVHHYPTISFLDFPKRIKELSPIAFKTYEQTIKAKDQGFDMLIGAGLRIALEWLVWDYLIKIQDKTESELERLKLHERINLMNKSFYTEVCTRLIRLFGNDSVHIIKKLDFNDDEVIEMFNLLCSLIDSELQIKEVNARLPKKSS